MHHSARLVAKDYWGTNYPPISLALTGSQMLRDAARYGGIANLTRYRSDGRFDAIEGDAAPLPIGLSHESVWLDTTEAGWTDELNGGAYLEEFPAPFSGGVKGLGHLSDEPASYSGGSILENIAHALRLYLLKAPESIAYPVTVAAWNSWHFWIAKNGGTLYRIASTWNDADEATLIELLGLEDPTSEQQGQIDDLRATLYADSASVSLEGDSSGSNAAFYELEFIPEDAGKVSVYCNGKFAGEADHTPILKTRKPGTVWGASALSIRRNGGHFYWQAGYPWFASNGQIVYPYRSRQLFTGENMAFNGLASRPAGTNVEFAHDYDNDRIVATFTTTDRRKTPFLYLCQGYLDATARAGGSTVAWDSDDHKDAQGNPPILEIEPQCEGELRRAQFNVQIRDVQGSTFNALGFYYETLEHRTADLYIDDALVIKNGLVKTATITDWGDATANQPRSSVARPDTCAQLEVCDAWTLLEEYELDGGEIVGDGLRLGLVLRRALRTVGFPLSELAGVASTAGRLLPTAVPGENWAVVNDACTAADFIYYLIERFGMGSILWRGSDGVWYFQPRSSAVRTLFGHTVEFSGDPARNDSESYPGRFAMLEPIDLPRDVNDFYNVYTVRGADGTDGEPLAQSYTIRESINRGGGPGSRKYIGRVRKMRPIEDGSLRTSGDLQYALRSAVELHGLPPRFLSFRTYYIPGLFIGDKVIADGSEYYVRRISGGSWKNDEMNLLLQEAGY
jgi:hypothetical protein